MKFPIGIAASSRIGAPLVAQFLGEERGATAVEYSIVAAGVALAVAGAIHTLGAQVLANLYSNLAGLFG